jgi:molecular chaperone GrpE
VRLSCKERWVAEQASKSSDGTAEPEEETARASEPEGDEDAAAAADPTEELTAERDRLYQQWLRSVADMDNLRKRTKKDIEEAARRAAKLVLLELLPIVDNLERAVRASEAALDARAVADGVQMVLKQFDDIATRVALERVKTVGERFDPSLHDAVQQIETQEHPPGVIVAEVVPGYLRLGELIRPAMVVVAKKPAATPDQGDGTTSGDG